MASHTKSTPNGCSVPSSSPFRRSKQSHFQFQTAPAALAGEQRVAMANEMEGRLVGPMPPDTFVDEFLPKCEKALPDFKQNLFALITSDKKVETEMYEPLANALKKNKLIPGYKVVNTSNHPDKNSKADRKIKPDCSLYKTTVSLTGGVTRFDELELSFELKMKHSEDPFQDPESEHDLESHEFLQSSAAAKNVFGQLVGYATEWCSLQHRTFAFSVCIFGTYARFIRWDRSGAVVSERFDYQKNPQILASFIWRFVHLEPEDQGRDTTVRKASRQEIKIAGEKLKQWGSKTNRLPVVFTVKDDGSDREFIGWGSMADAESLTGRATRAYPVWDIKRRKLCFLKDSWRAKSLEGEAEIIRRLNRGGVRYVPTVVCGGDIGHTTKTQMFVGATGGSSTATWVYYGTEANCVVERIHHRFVTNYIGQPLTRFPSTRQFIQAVFHAYIAHLEASEKCGVLHRDISLGNIMLDEKHNGVLNDWDLSKYITNSNTDEPHRNHERTGTWQFISAGMLIYPQKQHVLQDDLESFIWVVLYTVLRYTKHTYPPEGLQDLMTRVFDSYMKPGGHALGGMSKHHICLRPSVYLPEFSVEGNPILTDLIFDLLQCLGQWYSASHEINTQTGVPTSDMDPELGLRDHKQLYLYFSQALEKPNWPEGDKSVLSLDAPEESESSSASSKPKRKRARGM